MLDGALTDFERIDVAGVMTERLRFGQGRPLLYLHDGTGLEYSRTFLEGLARKFQVHALSHPGFGGSDLPGHFTSVDDLAYHYLDYIEAENLNDVVAVGASFGGWIAAELATKGSARLGKLVLIDAYGIKVGPRDKLDVADIFYLLPEEVRDLGWHAKRPPQKSNTIEGARRIARNRESLSLFGWSPLLHNPKLLSRLHRIKIPTLVLWGASDRLAPVDYGRAYAAAIKGAAFTLVPEAGHLPHMEQADAVIGHITKFVGV
jgi:pimeloyl-ACP methyl ester carboxylesterase